MRIKTIAIVTLSLLLILGAGFQATHAELQRVGPVSNSPTIGGFPAWYQDTTGLALEFCAPSNASEVDGGWCLLLPGDVPAPPEVFPTEFFDEHFWYSAGAVFPATAPVDILWEAALEAAFAADVAPGGQIVFTRIRVRFVAPETGTYRVLHPYGEETFQATAGERIFFTDDVGINCPPGQFHCAMEGRVGPFLLPSVSPGGPEMLPVTAGNPNPGGLANPTPYPGTGKSYIADPAREGPVTGSPLGPTRNRVRVEGPGIGGTDPGTGIPINFIETVNFTLVGRVFTGALAGRVTVDRASYTDPAAPTTANPRKVAVFATAFPSTQGRTPGGNSPAVVSPALQFYHAACAVDDITGDLSAPAGIDPTQMFDTGASYFGQNILTAIEPIPFEVCVQQLNAVDAAGNTVSAFFPSVLGDQVTISQALYEPGGRILTVAASSSDQANPPTLTLSGFTDPATQLPVVLQNGQASVSVLDAPPSKVLVRSSARGANEFQVSTGVGDTGSGTATPVARNDSAKVVEDSGANTINVLINDTVGTIPVPGSSLVTIVTPPLKGAAVVFTDTDSINKVRYTPALNASGGDSFRYNVDVGGLVSNVANVGINITADNDPPVAVNDTFNAVLNVSITLPVLANDLDVDGTAGMTVGVLNPVTPATATVTNLGNAVSFLATAAGTYTFTYQPRDAAGTLSANTATVTVIVAGQETVQITLAEYRRNQGRLRLTGTVAPVANPPQRMEVRWANGTNTISIVATPVADAAGNWAVDIRGATGIQNPDNSGATQVRVTSPGGGAATANIAFRQ
jgi:hypothetical protein